MQPLLLQSYQDQLNCKTGNVMIPANARGVLKNRLVVIQEI